MASIMRGLGDLCIYLSMIVVFMTIELPYTAKAQVSEDISYSLTTTGFGADSDTCAFNVSEEDIANLNESLEDGNFFVYLNLNFLDPFSGPDAYLEEGSSIISPLKWVYASKGKGNLLLALPFDFIQLSLGTLMPGVGQVNVNLELTDPTCFRDRNESDVLQEMAETLFLFSSLASQQEDDTFSICIERQLSRNELDKTISVLLPGSSYILFQTTTVYECWTSLGNGVVREMPLIISKYQGLIYSVYLVGIILALYSPLAGMFFVRICPSPPSSVNHKMIAIHADMPLGFKYNVMFSGDDNRWIRLIRWIVIILIFGLIPYLPYITWSAIGQLGLRMEAIDQAGVLSYAELFGFHIIIEMCYYVTVASLLVFSFESYDTFTELIRVQEIDRNMFGLVELDDALKIPESVETDNKIQERRVYGFFKAMIFRTFGIFNIGLYTYFFGSPYVWLQDKVLGPHLSPGVLATILTCLLYVIIFPVLVIFFVFNMMIYAIPLGDVLLFLFRKCYGQGINARAILIGIGIVLLAISMFFKFIAVFVYVGELIAFVFVGFLVNTETVGEYVTVGVLFAGFILNSITGYYDSYCQLLNQIFEIAEARDGKLRAAKKLQQTIAGTYNGTVTVNEIVTTNDLGVPFIKVDLFEKVINKYQPINDEIFKIFVQFCFMGLFVILGLSIIKTIDSLNDIPATVEVFATVVVAGVLPLVVLILRSPAKTECLNKSKWSQLEADIDSYATNDEFEKQFLQY